MTTISSRHGTFTITESASQFSASGPSFSASFDWTNDSFGSTRDAAYQNAVNAINAHIQDLADVERNTLHTATNVILTKIASEIEAIRHRCEDETLGILTRQPYNGWGTALHRAIAISALRTNGLLDKVSHEAVNPTNIPGEQ